MMIRCLIVLFFFTTIGCVSKVESDSVLIQANQSSVENAEQYGYVTEYFKDFIDPKKIGIEQITGDPNATAYFTTYLGTIRLNELDYHAISQFYAVKKETVKESYSRIIFLDKNIKVVKLYKIPRPEELPFAILRNQLVFEIDKQQYNVSLGNEFPRLICVDEFICL